MSVGLSRQFVAFLAAGGIAAMANIGSRIIFSHWLPFAAAIVTAYVVGMIVAFVLFRLFVFGTPQHDLRRQVVYFTGVNIAAVLQVLGISLLLARWLLPRWGFHQHVDTIAHTVGVAVPALTSYIGHRFFTFR